MCIGVIAVSLIGLLGVAKGNRRLMNLVRSFLEKNERLMVFQCVYVFAKLHKGIKTRL